MGWNMKHLSDNYLLLSVCVLVAALFYELTHSCAQGQKRIVMPADTAVALAQVCASETIWDAYECPAIGTALRFRAQLRGQSFRDVMRAHSDEVFNRNRTHRAWLPWLSASLARPRGWPSKYVPWRGYRAKWRRLIAVARHWLRRPFNPCEGEPTTWGNDEDRARYVRENPGAVETDCGPTRNHFMRNRP